MVNPSWWQLKRDQKHDLAFPPLETAVLEEKVDSVYSQSKVFQHIQEATSELAATSKPIIWTSKTPTEESRIIDMAPNPSAQNLVMVKIGKDFILKPGYIKNDFDVEEWADLLKRLQLCGREYFWSTSPAPKKSENLRGSAGHPGIHFHVL
ncbi:MAG: hypothetical protein WBN68_01350 [Sedimenticolaceae bacterium]